MAKRQHSHTIDFGETLPNAKKALDLLNLEIEHDAPLADWINKVLAEEQTRRLTKLAEHYGLSAFTGKFLPLLLIMVAREFVPGFDPYSKGKGAPRRIAGRWETANKVLALVMSEDGTQEIRAVSEACDILSRRKTIKDSKGKTKTASQIEADYYRFAETLAEMKAMFHDAEKAMKLDKERWESRRALLEDSRRSGTILGGASSQAPGATENSDDFP